MKDNLSIIREARHLIKNASSELCNSYNELCGKTCAEPILSVLDGELRMAEKLSQLEAFFLKDNEKVYASEYDIKQCITHNS